MENFEENVNAIVSSLKSNVPILINIQCPEEHSQYDVMFAWNFNNVGIHQRGLNAQDLLIGIVGWGFFGFRTDIWETSRDYYAEKLSLDSENLTLLFNEVRRRLANG